MESGVADLLRCSLLIAEVMESDVANLLRCSLLIAEVEENNVVVLLGSLRFVVEVVLESGTADPLGCSSLNTRSATGEERSAKGEAWNKMEGKEFVLHSGRLRKRLSGGKIWLSSLSINLRESITRIDSRSLCQTVSKPIMRHLPKASRLLVSTVI